MELSFAQLCAVTQGAVYFDEKDGAFRPHRFTPEEEALYSRTDYHLRVHSTAGIQLVFRTDATALALQVMTVPGSSRKYFCHDILADDVLVGTLDNYHGRTGEGLYYCQDYPLGRFSGEFDLGNGEKTVRIVLPWSVGSAVEALTLHNASFCEPVKEEKTVLIYGDSITHGYDSLNPSRTYAHRLARLLNAEGFNKAVGGEKYRPALALLKNNLNPDYITVAYGTNDWYALASAGELEQNCRDFLKNLRCTYPCAKIFVIAPIWRADAENDSAVGPISLVPQIVQAACEPLAHVYFIPGIDLVPHREECFADFRLHPSNEGFDHYFENLKNAIEPLL
jgi:lysophospholipase L1-like esterase